MRIRHILVTLVLCTYCTAAAQRGRFGELTPVPALRVIVKGFADAQEHDPAHLSAARARSVIEWLVFQGIARERMEELSCGATRPLWSAAAGPRYRAANRRVEIVRSTPTAGCQPPSPFAVPAVTPERE